jgi:ADP-ribose pyrophosphatase YjhB (NUDIX family)
VTRRDYYHDPDAPPATSLPPGGGAVITDGRGRILMLRRADSGNWTLPGGMQELGESLPEAVRREVREETGLEVEIWGLVGLYTDPAHVMAYDNGEVRQEFAVIFRARLVGGELRADDESTGIRFVDPGEFDALPIHETVRLRLRHALEYGGDPYLG